MGDPVRGIISCVLMRVRCREALLAAAVIAAEVAEEEAEDGLPSSGFFKRDANSPNILGEPLGERTDDGGVRG